MHLSSRRALLRALAASGALALAPRARSQSPYPARPVRLIVPYPPGALTDVLARAIAERVAPGLGQPVVVENKPGAGTLVGAEYVAKAAPDGYTLLMATSTTLGISPALYHPSPIDPVRDFAPIAQVGSVNFFLIANPAFPAHDVRGMIDAIKASPGKYNYASVGSGSPHHLFMETLKTQLGLEIQHVPYKGTPAALTDLLANNVQVMFCDATIALPNIKAGKVVALGTSAAKQTALLAGVPPIAATVPGFDWQAWQGIVAPAATPKDVVARLAAEIGKVQATQEFRDQLVRFGMEPFAPQAPADFALVIRSEQPRWVKAVRESGAKVD
jgi:tripartite-type tricarboxylate transporter receptor subunit TctC